MELRFSYAVATFGIFSPFTELCGNFATAGDPRRDNRKCRALVDTRLL